MPNKNVLILTEVAIVAIVWAACDSVWSKVITTGFGMAFTAVFPRAPKLLINAVLGAILIVVLYLAILLADNIDIGRTRVFELARRT
jgi:uncharacterized membrane protein (DUF373 family)